MEMVSWAQLTVVIALTLIHLSSKYFAFSFISLKQFMSLAGGVGVSYILLYVLPEVSHASTAVQEEISFASDLFVYGIALFSFSFFYIFDRLVTMEWRKKKVSDPKAVENRLFWAHLLFFIIYNAIIGYTLTKSFDSIGQLIIVFLAFALHFTTNDWGLRHHHEVNYDKYGRILLSLSVLLGYLIGKFTDFPAYILEMSEAFILGGLLLTVVKRELPSEEDENIPGFMVGIVISGVLFSLL